jgi:hypothetical protein
LQCLDRGEAAERVNAWEIMQATCNDLHRLAAQSELMVCYYGPC